MNIFWKLSAAQCSALGNEERGWFWENTVSLGSKPKCAHCALFSVHLTTVQYTAQYAARRAVQCSFYCTLFCIAVSLCRYEHSAQYRTVQWSWVKATPPAARLRRILRFVEQDSLHHCPDLFHQPLSQSNQRLCHEMRGAPFDAELVFAWHGISQTTTRLLVWAKNDNLWKFVNYFLSHKCGSYQFLFWPRNIMIKFSTNCFSDDYDDDTSAFVDDDWWWFWFQLVLRSPSPAPLFLTLCTTDLSKQLQCKTTVKTTTVHCNAPFLHCTPAFLLHSAVFFCHEVCFVAVHLTVHHSFLLQSSALQFCLQNSVPFPWFET